jgi:UDP-N-acetyl-D-galactosamine dehydrogenase
LELPSEILGVIGLDYVGLPLAVEFAKGCRVVGYDHDPRRIASLRQGIDATEEVSSTELAAAHHLELSDRADDLAPCNRFTVTVPTPVTASKKPDLTPLIHATETVAR